MLMGRMYLELDDGDRKQCYEADIPRCIDREQEIAFEFSGDDPDSGPFQGKAKLDKTASEVVGDGQFRWADGTVVDATLRGTVEYFDGKVIIEGRWLDESSDDEYELFIELEAAD
jgi:hypothetical protein